MSRSLQDPTRAVFRSRSEKTSDRTLSEVDQTDAPGLYVLQVLGFVVLIAAAAMIAAQMVLQIVGYLFAAT